MERYLLEAGVPHTVRDVFADVDALEELGSQGFMTTPVVRVGDEWVAGFRREELDRLLTQ